MNCQDFNYNLHDYLDQTLAPEAQAAAREHLRQCDVCRMALSREANVARSVHRSLDHAAAGLSLRPETRRNVLRALEPKTAPPSPWLPAWRWLVSTRFRPLVAAGAALLAGILLLLALQFQRQTARRTGPQEATQNGLEAERVVNVPLQTQTHVFQRENDTIIDAVIPGTAMEHVVVLTRNK